MSKTKKLRKKFAAFVNQLSPAECREQLVLAYLQMEKCMQVLRGANVEPVDMKDNGENSDLELFYMCKKVREELDCLNQEEKSQMTDAHRIKVITQENFINSLFKELDDFFIKAMEDYMKKEQREQLLRLVKMNTPTPFPFIAFHHKGNNKKNNRNE